MSIAIVPGSFDPMTLGHRALVEQALEHYDQVIVAVMNNADKTYLFDMNTRLMIARRTVEDLPAVRVLCDEGLLVDLYRRTGADAVCKGYRNDADYAYECRMAEWNRAHEPTFRTVLLKAGERYPTLSSTEVRSMLKKGETPSGLVHPAAIPLILSKGGEA